MTEMTELYEGSENEVSEDNVLDLLDTLADDYVLSDNLIFLEWYFKGKMDIRTDGEKQRVFSFLTYSIIEDPHCFLRILLYIANTRRTVEQELFYKVVVHFLATMFPELVMANLELFVSLGKKDDVLYFLQCPNITERVITWIKHKARSDSDFETLMSGKVIGDRIRRRVYYKPRFKKNNKWSPFLMKILNDPTFNGISA